MTNDGYVAMQVIQAVNGWLFGGPVLILLFGIHVYFTIYTGVVQRKLGTGIRLSLRGTGTEKKGMSSFGTLTTTLAATLGTGNIIGVSTAVSLGGPGRCFGAGSPACSGWRPHMRRRRCAARTGKRRAENRSVE